MKKKGNEKENDYLDWDIKRRVLFPDKMRIMGSLSKHRSEKKKRKEKKRLSIPL